MSAEYATLGYGFHLEETRVMLDQACVEGDQTVLRDYCIENWPQKSTTNKQRMWTHLSKRYLDFADGKRVQSPFLSLYRKVKQDDQEGLDLIFFQLCCNTPVVFETLRSLATESFLNTGEAVFSKYHLDQLLESIFGRVTKSTCERIRQILMQANRLRLQDGRYIATAYCPREATLGYSLYLNSQEKGWRAPSTAVLMEQSTIAPAFLCNRALLMGGLKKLAARGHCEYHQHGSTDQVQLIHRSLQEYVDAWQ